MRGRPQTIADLSRCQRDGRGHWIRAFLPFRCEGIGTPGEPPKFARNHRDIQPTAYFFNQRWRT
jgi:hypothetical protein